MVALCQPEDRLRTPADLPGESATPEWKRPNAHQKGRPGSRSRYIPVTVLVPETFW